MTTQQHLALLIDLHPPSSSSSSSPSPFSTSTDNHIHLFKNKINDLLVKDHQASFVKVYVLTSSEHFTRFDLNEVVPSDERVEAAVFRADDKIASFYEAKQKLDDMEIREIKLICDDTNRPFWDDICKLLFTPVHKWSVVAAGSTGDGEGSFLTNLSGQIRNGSNGTADNTTHGYSQQSTSSKNQKTAHPPSDTTKAQVQRFLHTLPSLLGAPEVNRSNILPELGSGFVHGYSTRRGGVTTVPTLCSMNMVYTDLKPDSRLVIDENRRRLASVGGFDYQNFHITRVEHGHRVWVVGEDQPLKFDALVTNRRDVTIAAAGADCIPLLFADPVAMVIGAAHAGWKGTVERVAACVVNTMKEKFGSRPEDIRVAMGPGVKPGCFVVPVEDVTLFTDIHPSCVLETADTESHKIDGIFQQSVRIGRGERSVHEAVQHTSATGDQRKCEKVERNEAKAREEQKGGNILDTNTTLTKSPQAVSVSTSSEGVDSVLKNCSTVTSAPGGTAETSQSDFHVKLIPTEQLMPRKPRSPKDPKRQWVFVDLQLTNYHVLLQAGVKAEHIDMSTSHCTRCNTDLYFSNERDGFPFGNQIGFFYMPSSVQ
ncbi:uncharacterized protein [Littorina saxatilis]|uniref:Uncharacterized protein n=1 Tax=Littorina saxatilis TaxID=31220 RepID=A0AAN9ALA5_9CAEN